MNHIQMMDTYVQVKLPEIPSEKTRKPMYF